MRAHARALWGRLGWAPALPWTLPWIGYACGLAAAGLARLDHVLVATLAVTTVCWSARTRRFYLNALPFFALFVLYDSLRFWLPSAIDPARVLGCRLRDLELALFGVPHGGGRITLNDLFAAHHHPLLDLLCAVPYGAYVPLLIGHWMLLYARDEHAARRFACLALATHLFGFATYDVLPAAPPWYVRAHGCAVESAPAMNPAGLARVDALLGTTYFAALYGRGSTVFGALPSLHVCYPLYGLLVTWRRAGLVSRALQLAYAASMTFAALYLDHHYAIDVLLGFAYCALSFVLVRALLPAPADPPSAAPATRSA